MVSEELRPYRAKLLDEGLRLSRELNHGAEGDSRATKMSANALMMEGRILVEKGERARAHEIGMQSVALFEDVIASNPTNTENRATLAHLLHDSTVTAADRDSKISLGRRSNEIYTDLLGENPRSEQASGWIGSIVLNFHNIGSGYFEEGQSATGELKLNRFSKAIEAFRESLRFCAQQVEQQGLIGPVLYPRALNERYLCRALIQQAIVLEDPHQKATTFDEAITWGKKAIADFQALADQDLSHYRNSDELHQAQRELGIAFYERSQWDKATEFYSEARETLKRMRQRHGNLVSRLIQIQVNIAIDDHNLVMALTSNSPVNQKIIRELVDEACAICESLDALGLLSNGMRRVYADVSFVKADVVESSTGQPDIDLNRNAARLYQELLDQNPADYVARCYVVLIRLDLADALAALGRDDESKKIEDDAMAAAKGFPDVLLQTAYTYAVNSIETVKGPNERDNATRAELRKRYARRVIPLLRAAASAGFKDVGRLQTDQAFDPFRADPAFRAIEQDVAFPNDSFKQSESKAPIR